MGMTDPWRILARRYGRKSVMALDIDDATLDAETERQAAIIFPLIRAALRGDEKTAIDYGCGAGRFTRHLDKLVSGTTYGYDPCAELIDARGEQPPSIQWITGDPDRLFAWDHPPCDIVFTAMVLGEPNIDIEATAADLVSRLAPYGLLVVLDHMPDTEPLGRWWRFRPKSFYFDLFARNGVTMREIGRVQQLDNEVTILARQRG